MSSEALELGSAARHALVLSVGDIAYNFVLAVGAIAVARLLGSEGYGAYSLSLSVPLLIYSLINLGLDTGISRYVRYHLSKGDPAAAFSYAKAALVLKVLVGAIATTTCFIGSRSLSAAIINRPELYPYVALASAAAILDSLFTYLLAVFVGLEEVWKNSLLKVVYSFIRTSLAVVLLLAGLGLTGALASYLIGLAASVLLGFTLMVPAFRGKSSGGRGPDTLEAVRELVVYSLPLYVSSLLSSVVALYQTALLARVLADFEIGGYRALLNLQTLVSVVLGPIATALLPAYTKLDARGDPEALTRALVSSNRYTAVVVVPLTFVSAALSKELIYLIYGPDYLFASPYLPLVLAPFLLSGLGSATIPQLFNAVGKTRLNMYVAVASASVFVSLSYVATVHFGYGLWGFLASSLTASAVSTTLYNVLLRRRMGVSLGLRKVLPVYLSSALALPALAPFMLAHLPRPASLIKVLAGGMTYLLAYACLSVLLRALGEGDVEFIERTFSRVPVLGVVVKLFASEARKLLKLMDRSSGSGRGL